jgi:uncharacterized protein (TIGR02246 family)
LHREWKLWFSERNRRRSDDERVSAMVARFLMLTHIVGRSLLIALSLVGPWAGAKEEVAAAGENWAAIFVDDNPEAIPPLYDDGAVMWGTLSSRLAGKQALRGYFEMAFKALPGHKVAFGDQLIRIYGDIAIDTGYYTFSYVKDGDAKSLPARYSFVYRNRDGNWLIVDHHSSAMPAPPK